jgi:hypothetical protein
VLWHLVCGAGLYGCYLQLWLATMALACTGRKEGRAKKNICILYLKVCDIRHGVKGSQRGMSRAEHGRAV